MQEKLKRLTLKSKKAALVFRAINNKLRQQIIQFLIDHPKTNVSNLYRTMRIEQSGASQHLAILRQQGIAVTERNGKEIYYSINQERVQEIELIADQLLKN